MTTVNEVFATGKIISTGRDNRGYSSITIVIRGRHPAVVRFVVDKLNSGIGVGDSVTIKGHTKAYSYYNEIQERRTYVQYFVADELTKNETELKEKFGIEGHHYKESSFRAYVAGEVYGSLETSDPKWCKLTVKVDGIGKDQRNSYITFSYFRSKRLPDFDYKKGDKVYLVASITTPQKELNGRTVNFENLVIEDIVKEETEDYSIDI